MFVACACVWNRWGPHTSDPPLLTHLSCECDREPAHHCGVDGQQAHADCDQHLPAVAGGQRPDDGRVLHALHPHPQHTEGFHLWSCNVQDRVLLHG